SATDVWAVGNFFDSGIAKTLIEHWNGNRWHVLPSPNPGRQPLHFDVLNGVSAVSPTDAWAVGFEEADGSTNQFPIALRWKGQKGEWIRVRSPRPPDSTRSR